MNNLSDCRVGDRAALSRVLNVLEFAVPRSGENLDTDQAAVWTHNAKNRATGCGCSTSGAAACAGSWACRQAPALADNGLDPWWSDMQPAALQDRIRWGMNAAARKIGASTDAYRPSGASTPLDPVNRFLRLPAAFSGIDGNFGRPVGYGSVTVARLFRCSLYATGRLSGPGSRRMVRRGATAAASGALCPDEPGHILQPAPPHQPAPA